VSVFVVAQLATTNCSARDEWAINSNVRSHPADVA